MAAYFWDSSALVKRYILETGSTWVQALTDATAGHDLFIVRLTMVEITSAITRRGRGGTIPPGDVATILGQFRREAAAGFFIMDLTPTLLDDAVRIAETYALRANDAVQLAAALDIAQQSIAAGRGPITFASADAELNLAATAEGLVVDDPNLHP
jgi:predicted nucleic acid-binding protein